MFVRAKRSRGRDYAYIVENFRNDEGQTRQRVVRYLGPLEPRTGGRPGVDLEQARKELLRDERRREQA